MLGFEVRTLKMTLIILGSLIALPVLLPYLLISETWRGRTIRKIVAGSACIQCGVSLSKQSIILADNFRTDDMLQFKRDHPDARRAMGQKIVAICSSCNTAYCFDHKAGGFVLSKYQPGAAGGNSNAV